MDTSPDNGKRPPGKKEKKTTYSRKLFSRNWIVGRCCYCCWSKGGKNTTTNPYVPFPAWRKEQTERTKDRMKRGGDQYLFCDGRNEYIRKQRIYNVQYFRCITVSSRFMYNA